MAGLNRLGLWVKKEEITTPVKIDGVMKLARKIGAERLYLQVVGRGDSYYDSEFLPRSESLEDNGFDPLGYAVGCASDFEIKISAWMNANFVWPFVTRPKSPCHVINLHPEWVTCDQNGVSMLDYENTVIEELFGVFLDPALPQVQRFFADIASEITGKYEVEELHGDFLRYPHRTFGCNPLALELYRAWLEGNNFDDSEKSFDDFRLLRISEEVRAIRDAVHGNGANLSVAVYDRYDERAIYEMLQPWVDWMKRGYIDFGVMMAYSPEPEEVASCVGEIRERAGSLEKVRVGLGAFKVLDGPEKLISLMDSVSHMGPDEITLFSSTSVASSTAMQKILENTFRRT